MGATVPASTGTRQGLRVSRPRLRHRTEGEVNIPAYEALRKNDDLSQCRMAALMRGISTREYHQVPPKIAETVGVSRRAISRQARRCSGAATTMDIPA